MTGGTTRRVCSLFGRGRSPGNENDERDVPFRKGCYRSTERGRTRSPGKSFH